MTKSVIMMSNFNGAQIILARSLIFIKILLK
jgi:hypothetical protein